MKHISFALAAVLFAACSPAPAPSLQPPSPAVLTSTQTPAPPATDLPVETAMTGPTPTIALQANYLMAFHACDTGTVNDCHAPQNHRVYLAQSDDGLNWSLVPGMQPYPGSVPDVVRRGNTLYIYSAGQNPLLRFHLDSSQADEPQQIQAKGLPFGLVDPSPIIDDDGRIVLFFLPGQQGADPAGCSAEESSCTRTILSAVEVEGSDGQEFELVDGPRVSFDIDPNSEIKSVSDPDIFFDGQQYVIYISHGPSISVWTSPTMDGEFQPVNSLPQGLLTLGTGGVPAGHFDAASGLYWTYAHIDINGRTVIRLAQHADYSRRLETNDFEIILSGDLLGLGDSVIVASPGFALNQP